MTYSPMREKIDELLEIMAALRTPETGCPWDLEQNFRTIAPYTIEEAYEVADAIERDDMSALKEELGDLLFQVVFHAQMAEEIGAFDFHDVASVIGEKMTRRHPHVFDAAGTRTAEEQTVDWERMKAAERANKGAAGLLDDVPIGMPALTRAVKLQKRAARVGFDWAQARDILAKVIEEDRRLGPHAEPVDIFRIGFVELRAHGLRQDQARHMDVVAGQMFGPFSGAAPHDGGDASRGGRECFRHFFLLG